MNLLSGADFYHNTGALMNLPPGGKVYHNSPEKIASAKAHNDYLMAIHGGPGLMNLKTQDEMLQRHHPEIYKQFMAGVPVEELEKKYPKVVQQYRDGEIGEDDIDYFTLMNLSSEDDLMNLSGLSESTKAKIAKAHPDIAKQFAAGASVSSLVKKNPALAKQFGISLMNLSSDDDLMNLSGLSEATKAKIAKAHPEIAKQFAAGASVSSLVKKNPALAKQFGVSLMNLDDSNNVSFIL